MFVFEIRFKKNHCWLPGHGCGCPALWLHCGHSQLLLGGKPDPARGWTPFPHDRYVEHLWHLSQKKVKAVLQHVASLCYLSVNFIFTCEKSNQKILWLWWAIQNLKKIAMLKTQSWSLLWCITRLDGDVLGLISVWGRSDFSVPFFHIAPLALMWTLSKSGPLVLRNPPAENDSSAQSAFGQKVSSVHP